MTPQHDHCERLLFNTDIICESFIHLKISGKEDEPIVGDDLAQSGLGARDIFEKFDIAFEMLDLKQDKAARNLINEASDMIHFLFSSFNPHIQLHILEKAAD
jgi:hypothetical protein